MARFHYRMQNILNIKEKLEAQEKAAFAQANMRVLEEQDKLKNLLLKKAGYERKYAELTQGTININDIKICRNSIDSMKSAIRDQMIVLSRAQRELEIQRQKLNEAMKERKMHENLKEKAFEKFVAEENRLEGKVIDELVSYTYGTHNSEG